MHSAVMMEGWRACFIVLVLDLTLARDIPANNNQTYVIKNTDSCPDVGYYFKREPSPNAVDPGPCFLCFCQDNSTAICWLRENRRCDVEKYHHHRVGRQSRYRRSPIGLSDIFFRDASRDFFDRQMPEECKPFESSFSDGCPPADWCIGCTVCDCDANGRWDCHILSFCDGKEMKKKVKLPSRRATTRRAGRSMLRQNQDNLKRSVNATHPVIRNNKNITTKNVKEKPIQNMPQKVYINKPYQIKPNVNILNENKYQQKSNINRPIGNKTQADHSQYKKIQSKSNNNLLKATRSPTNNIKNKSKPTKKQNLPNKNLLQPNKNLQKPNKNLHKPNKNLLQPNKNLQKPNKNIQKPNKNLQTPNKNLQKPNKYISKTQAKARAKASNNFLNPNKNQSIGKENRATLKNKYSKHNTKPEIIIKNKLPKKQKTKQPLRKPIRKMQTVKLQRKNLSQIQQKSNSSKIKIINKDISNHKPMALGQMKNILNNNNNDTIMLGQRVVKQVMASVEKMIQREMKKMNATRPQRSVHDCGDTQKRDKKSLLFQRKYKKHKNNTLVDDFHSGRFKREILVSETKVDIENGTVANKKVLQGNISVISDKINEPKNNSLMDVPTDLSSTPAFNTRQDNHPDYYKYSLHNDASNISTLPTAGVIKNLTERTTSNKFIDFMIPVNSVRNISSDTMDNETVAAINPDFNDLKFRKWYVIKIRKESKNKPVERVILPKSKPSYIFEKANTFLDLENVTKYVETSTERRGLQLTKILSKNNLSDTTSEYVHNTLMNLLQEMNKNHTGEGKIKSKSNVMTYVRKFFHKMFTKKKHGSHKVVYGLGAKEDHTLQILCENLGPCEINRNNKLILKYKLRQLNKETGNILRSIRIIKGLLHLLDLPGIYKTNMNSTSRSDIQKLSAVLKERYNNDEINPILTKTQLTQITYIKENTQTFIDCIKRFADILNEILTLIKTNTVSMKHAQRKKTNTVPYEKIKKIITKYNVLQNTFLRRIYDLIRGDEKKTTTSTTELAPTIMDTMNDNSTEKSIENYSRNIIENLRKLKNLAQALTSKRKKRSLESNNIRDDTVDYLLNLMQYMITQNQPVENNQAYDGIDVLIDAIKNSPDIKPIPTYVFNSTIHEIVVSSAEEDLSEHVTDSKKVSREENQQFEDIKVSIKPPRKNVDYDAISNSNKRKFNDITTVKQFKFSTPDYTSVTTKLSNEELEKTGFEKLEKYINENKKYEVYNSDLDEEADGIDNAMPMVINKTEDDLKDNFTKESAPEINTEKEIIPETNMHELNVLDKNVPEANLHEASMLKTDIPETNIPEAYVPEVNMPEINTPETNMLGVNIPETNISGENLPQESKPRTKSKEAKDRTKHLNFLEFFSSELSATMKSKESSESPDSDSETKKKSKLDWLEVTFDKEIREYVQLNASEESETRTTSMPILVKKDIQVKDNISSMSRENKEETKKYRIEKTTSGDNVMYNKQMEFLKSLDYGTERTEIEDSDTKDYVSHKTDDTFPSYFV